MTASSTPPSTPPSSKHAALVPRLRFPEFEGEWSKSILSDIVERVSERIGSNELTFRNYTGVENLVANFGGRIDASSIPVNANVINYFPDDILISNIRPYLSKIWQATHVGGASNDVIVLRARSEISHRFSLHVVQNDMFIEYVMSGAKGVKMPRGDISLILQYSVPLPTLPEQQKIADCLSALDDLIAAESDKLEALKKHKKGLMQELFPREGETVPRIRFPEFEGSGGWEVRRLGEVAQLKSGYAFKSSSYSDIGKYRIVTISNVQNGRLALESTNTIESIPSDIQSHQILFQKDILISMTGNVGRTCQVTDDNLLLNQRVGKLIPLHVSADFFYQLTQRDVFREGMQQRAAGGAQGNLSGGSITNYLCAIPSLSEQEKIASILSSVDDRITAQSERIETLKEHKKGLMQGLFPVMER